MTGRQPRRLRELLPEVTADLAQRHLAANGELPPMTTIWRYPLPLTDRVTHSMPRGARPLHVDPFRQPPASGLYYDQQPLDLWVLVEAGQPVEPRTFLIVGTGNPVPADAGAYVGTAHSHGGDLIWHVFEASPGEVPA